MFVKHDDIIALKRFPHYRPFRKETTGGRWIPSKQGSVAQSLDAFISINMNKLLIQQSSYQCLRNIVNAESFMHVLPDSEWPVCKLSKHWLWNATHYNDVIMGVIASQITSLTIVYSTVYSGADPKKNMKATRHCPLCGEFTGDGWIPGTNGQWRGKCFHLMTSSWMLPGSIINQFCAVFMRYQEFTECTFSTMVLWGHYIPSYVIIRSILLVIWLS